MVSSAICRLTSERLLFAASGPSLSLYRAPRLAESLQGGFAQLITFYPIQYPLNAGEVVLAHWRIMPEPSLDQYDARSWIELDHAGLDQLIPRLPILIGRPAKICRGISVWQAIAAGAVLVLGCQEIDENQLGIGLQLSKSR